MKVLNLEILRGICRYYLGALKGTELRRQTEPKTQIFAENRRFSQIHPFSWKFKQFRGAGFLQKTEEIFAENRRKPQIGLRHLRCVTFSSALGNLRAFRVPECGSLISLLFSGARSPCCSTILTKMMADEFKFLRPEIITVSGSIPTPWSGPFWDHGLRRWSQTPSEHRKPLEIKDFMGLGRPFLDLVSQTPRPYR